ncbi:MAG: biotin-dependent carboxyltransferase family protein [Streptosporangiales bacterium]
MKSLEVVRPGPLSTVQDLGRPGKSELGIGWSGACDRGALRLANRLVGNPEDAAAIEATFGGLEVRAAGALLVAVTGAPCPVTVDGTAYGCGTTIDVPPGAVLRLGRPAAGLRTYSAVRGGIAVPPVLGCRSTDLLAGIGPERLAEGTTLPVGAVADDWPPVDVAPVPAPPVGEVTLRVLLGPRDDWFEHDAIERLVSEPYEVTPESNRIGMRLDGPQLTRAVQGELPSEGLVAGAVQVPPSGKPTVFLADHPVTGGYPVLAVVCSADLDRAGQLRPGQPVRFRRR